MREQITIEEKMNAPLADNVTRRMSYTKREFPQWNIMMERVYIGISAENWKQRLYNHRHSFSNQRLRNQTALNIFGTLKIKG